MEFLIQHHFTAATFMARVFLGILFFFQGYDAVFKVKVQNVIETYEFSFQNVGIPKWITTIGAYFTSYVELIFGLFLILGLFEYVSLYLLGFNLLLVCFTFSLAKPMWDLKYVFPRFALILFLLSVPPEWDVWSLDSFLFNK